MGPFLKYWSLLVLTTFPILLCLESGVKQGLAGVESRKEELTRVRVFSMALKK